MEDNQQNPSIGFHTDSYYEFLLQAAQAESLGFGSKLEEGIQLFEKYMGKEQVEKDYHAAVDFWKTIEGERLQNIETRDKAEGSENEQKMVQTQEETEKEYEEELRQWGNDYEILKQEQYEHEL